MKDRRPRKEKKQLKKRFGKMMASRIVQCALTTASSVLQTAMISAQPNKDKRTAILGVVIECATSLSNIMKSGPQNWREA